jgi:hypothetical protein
MLVIVHETYPLPLLFYNYAPLILETSINPDACIDIENLFFYLYSLVFISKQENLSRMPDGLSQIWDDPGLFFEKEPLDNPA